MVDKGTMHDDIGHVGMCRLSTLNFIIMDGQEFLTTLTMFSRIGILVAVDASVAEPDSCCC